MRSFLTLVCYFALFGQLFADDRDSGGPLIEKMNRPVVEIPRNWGWWGSKTQIQLKDYRGKVILLHFFTNGDKGSEANFPIFLEWKRELANKGLFVLSVNLPTDTIDLTDERVKDLPESEQAKLKERFLKEDRAIRERAKTLEQSFPIIFATNGGYLRSLLNVPKDDDYCVVDPKNPSKQVKVDLHVPSFFLIDRKGNSRYYVQGPLVVQNRKWDDQIEAKIKSLLSEK
jgi:thiol-disulfide isomerase/thioredoxin